MLYRDLSVQKDFLCSHSTVMLLNGWKEKYNINIHFLSVYCQPRHYLFSSPFMYFIIDSSFPSYVHLSKKSIFSIFFVAWNFFLKFYNYEKIKGVESNCSETEEWKNYIEPKVHTIFIYTTCEHEMNSQPACLAINKITSSFCTNTFTRTVVLAPASSVAWYVDMSMQ